ncbi:response regulator [Pseudoalteromonas sp. CO348]|uniref:CHASE domain-containing protein n=1 Tax=Pseudoalteromonas sp. CO348 TaxID=1777271 RepID=UPI001023A4F7|nr:CHASE domain-containing protein [Pseudoalteromonas sp. CO348]RZG04788.1 response regulator [Pseudoalteromonas sp. CO348]
MSLANAHTVRQSRFLPLVAALLVLVGSMLYGLVLYEQEKEHHAEKVAAALASRLDHVTEGVNERVTLYWYGILGLRTAIYANQQHSFDYQAMQRYIRSFDFQAEYSGARGVGIIKYVPVDNVSSFVQQAQAERTDRTFSIKTLNPHNTSKFVIQYIEPEVNNDKAVGLDIGSEASRRTAAIEAATANEPRLTAPITLVQADNKIKYGFLILAPIYSSIGMAENEENRLDNLVGWTYSPLLIDEILSTLLSFRQDVSIQISDVTNNDENTPFYQVLKEDVKELDNSVAKQVNLFGRTWEVKIWPTPQFIRSLNLVSPNTILQVALLVSALLAIITYILLLSFTRQRLAEKEKLAAEEERAQSLAKLNSSLEQEVKARTKEIVKYSQLHTSIVEGSGYAIVATDPDGIITQFNPAAERLLGYKKDELIGKSSPAIFHLEEEVVARAKTLTEELGRVIEPGFEVFVAKAKQGVVDTSRWTYVTKQNQYVQIKLNVTTLTDERGNVDGFLGIALDLTEQLKHERELSHAKEAAEQAAKAKAVFLANMSHEIRTPMNGLYGTLQLLKSEPLNSTATNLLEKATYSVKALNTIINDILDFSKIEAGRIELEERPFNIEVLVEHLRSDFLVLAKNKGLKLKIHVELEHKFWLGDEVRVRQVLLNLLSNSIKFTDTGSIITHIKPLQNDSGMLITVADTGIGMTEATINKLFSRFEQADKSTTRKFGGTGLGLSITRSLIDLMGGTIKVESTIGEGSLFSIELPMQKSEVTSEQPKGDQLKAADLSGTSILLAEDNPVNQLVVRSMISKANGDIAIANNGKESIEQFELNKPDLILMDIQMPEMDGVEACKRLKSKDPNIPIIALTANAFPEDKALYERVGFDGYVAKPIEQLELINTIATILAHSRNMQ